MEEKREEQCSEGKVGEPDKVPGEPAYSNDQGQDMTCTVQSLGKAKVDGYHNGLFPPGKKDFSQQEAIDKLLVLHKDKSMGKWPVDFDQMSITLREAFKNNKT